MSASFAISALLSGLRESMVQETINKEIEVLVSSLRNLQSLMVDADERLDKDDQVRGWVAEIRDICYDVEDVVDDYALKVEAMRRRGGLKEIVKRYFCISCEVEAANKAKIANYNGRIMNLMDLVGTQVSAAKNIGSSEEPPRRPLPLNRTSSLFNEGNIGGFEEARERVESHLLSGDTLGLVIAICGMPGAGKTTLAWIIFGSDKTASYFPVRLWITVGQTYKMRSVLLDMLSRLGEPRERIMVLDKMALLGMLYRYLKGWRYLVVLDDVWSIKVWEKLRRAFPQDWVNSKVLVTTRFRHVADEMVADGGYVHEIGISRTDPSWDHFKTIVFPDCPDNEDLALKKIAMDILAKCNGVPLAVLAVGSLLARKAFSEWEMVRHKLDTNLQPEFGPSEDSLTVILNICYQYLPADLKPCFIYLGHFPMDSDIEAEKLCLLWIAEGLIPLGQQEETTTEILDDLVARSLVLDQADEVPTITKFKSYRLRDPVRSFCLRQAKADDSFEVLELIHSNILNQDYPSPSSTTKIRRLAIYLDKYKKNRYSIYLKRTVSGVMEKANHLRSLMFLNAYHRDQHILWPEEISTILKELRFLRVLHFDGFKFQSGTLPEGIHTMVHLRYLSLGGCYLKEMQSYIGDLLNLQTLDLRVATSCKVIIPDILWKLERLRHLYLPVAFQPKGVDKLRFAGLGELQILRNFDTRVCDAQHLLELTNIQILEATTSGNDEDLRKIIEHMKKTSMREVTLQVRSFDCYTEKRLSIVAELLSSSSLQTLHIGGRIGKLPEINTSGLTELSLSGYQLVQDAMATLETLPELRVLVLRDGAYVGEEMVLSDPGFLELRQLHLCGLHKLKRLSFKSKMPNFTSLRIERCKSLELPDGLDRTLRILKRVAIARMPQEFEDGLRQVLKERQSHELEPFSVKVLDDKYKEERVPWLV